MKFGEKPISKCIGDLLVNSVKLPDGKLPKGTSLSKAHIQKLRSVGLTSILVASLEEGDVDENLAAKLLSNAFKKMTALSISWAYCLRVACTAMKIRFLR